MEKKLRKSRRRVPRIRYRSHGPSVDSLHKRRKIGSLVDLPGIVVLTIRQVNLALSCRLCLICIRHVVCDLVDMRIVFA